MLKIFSFKEKKEYLFLLVGLLFSLSGCNSNRLDIDVSAIKLEMKAQRFEKEIFEQKESLGQNFDFLQKKYGVFFHLFCMNVINIGDPSDSATMLNLKKFIEDKEMNLVYRETIEKFPELASIENELTDAFRHYKHYFPARPVPRLVSFVSGFNYGVITADSLIGIGLDMYLGPDYKYYAPMGFPKYKIARMNKNYIAVDCIKGWVQSEFESSLASEKDLLSQMIYQGKILYFVEAMMPDLHDTIKIGYSLKQLEWAENNEHHIWAFFIEKNLLFSTNSANFMKFINDGPTTNGLPKESPSMLGAWIGWNIVRNYMENNEKISLEQLMNENDHQKILNFSKYKPRK